MTIELKNNDKTNVLSLGQWSRPPLSFTGNTEEMVPGVCPGVKYIVMVVSPNVSF